MKKVYFSLSCLFLLLSFGALSQDSSMSSAPMSKSMSGRHVAFGIKAGVNLANVVSRKFLSPKGADILVAPFGGAYVTIPSGKGFAIQPEVVYNGLGWKEILTPSDKSVKYTFGFISVPLFAKYSFEKTGLAIYLGPQADFLISAKQKSDSSKSIKDDFKSTGFSAVGGLEYMFPNGFNFSVRYELGLSNLIKNPAPDAYLKLHAINLTVGYSFL